MMALAIVAGCSGNTLLTKKDYQASVDSLARGDPHAAIDRFPKGEENTFITNEEKAYLDLLQNRPNLDGLKKYRDMADERFRYEISKEIRSFFYLGTPEGYYASEHEIIWMHMLLSWGYSLSGKFENACVEARRATFLLEAPWSAEGHFDDPELRVILGALWAMCGQWESAQVVFRAAATLDPTLTWARELAERDRPPRNLFLVLGGVGPEPYWDPDLELNPLRGARHLGFRPQGRRSPLYAPSGDSRVPLNISPGSAPWYQRHLVRDNAIHDLINDTHYGLESSYELGLHGVKTVGAVAIFVGASVAGIAGGYLVARLCLEGNCGEGAVAIIGLPIAGFTYGSKKYREIEDESKARLNEKTDASNYYRFVRFLPEYAWIGWSDEPLGDSIDLQLSAGGNLQNAGSAHAVGAETLAPRVYLGFVPDVYSSPVNVQSTVQSPSPP
jgi:hypothetical protein